MKPLIPHENVHQLIYLIRGQKVMLDEDLADLYQVRTKALIQAVKRNLDRFPEDFMFKLSVEEAEKMRSHFVTASRRNVRYAPYVFTEHGVAMLSSVLRSQRAVQINIMIMRAFARLRQLVSLNRSLAKRLAAIERKLTGHDADVRHLYKLIQELHESPQMIGVGFKP